MPLKIDPKVTPGHLSRPVERVFEASAEKILSLEKTWRAEQGAPVFTVDGKYTARGWTEWTQGFQFGSALLQFDATGDDRFLDLGRKKTVEHMAPHVSHMGVHDHGFNNISTYGTLHRLMREGKIPHHPAENNLYALALKVSGAVQAARWTPIANGQGYIYSFNGPHSLFIDTIRSLRSLILADQLGHVLMGEQDERISLRERAVSHLQTTAEASVYYGQGRDIYDIPGRVAHESIFNTESGHYRCPNSQQGYSPFSTWMRGLAWAICGFAEQLEYFYHAEKGEPKVVQDLLQHAATVTAEFYLKNCAADGVPVWDSGAPNLHRLDHYGSRPADPFNPWEPVDSSAAAIAAQGLLRLGNVLRQDAAATGNRYRTAALTIARTLMREPYLSSDSRHQGLLLHSVYHRPNGWDHVPKGRKVPCGESSMWGDYHLRELALLILREARGEVYPTFFLF